MNDNQLQEQINWFTFSLAAQKNNMARLFLRLRSIGAKAGTSMAFHRKFMHLMEQVAVEQKKELNLICDIEEMEKRHAKLRRERKLRQASDDPVDVHLETNLRVENEPEPKPAHGGLLKLLALWMLFSNKPMHNKNQ